MTETTKKPPYGIIAIMMIGAFVSMFNETLLNVALPSIMKDLAVEPSTVQWLSTGYMLVNGVLIPTSAFLIQRFSVRNIFLTAMLLFTAGTITAGFAHTFSLLLTARLIQASGAAIMMPLLMNVMMSSFPIEKRGMAMGLFGIVFMTAPAIGPTLSGWLLEHYNWRMLFHVVSPIAFAVVLIGFFLLKGEKKTATLKLNYISLILSSIGFGGLLYGFSSAGSKGWDWTLANGNFNAEVYAALIIGFITLIIFIFSQLKSETPMLNFKVYKYPMFALSSVISMVVSMAMFSAMLLLPIYIQNLRGISTIKSGLLMLPGALIMGIMMPINGRLFDKYGARVLAVPGLTITVITTYLFSQLTLDTSYTNLVLLYTLRMFGMSMVMMPVMTNGLNQLPRHMNPHGTAMNSTLQQVAGAMGASILVTIMSNRTKTHATELAAKAIAAAKAAAAKAAEAGGPVLDAAQQKAAQLAMQKQITTEAMLKGINDAFMVSVGIAAVALTLALFIKRVVPAKEETKQVG
ncbi:MAG: Drug/metabolite transporter, superfamily protein [Bacillales bacterium]|nr:Drug/metabolite transporter, superfamily protein [Bacillales bacterium]